MKICVLAGGVGGARFLVGVRRLLNLDDPDHREQSEHRIDAVVNVGDDAWMHGVRICPDLDTCMYTLGGAIDTERGWGHSGETWHCAEQLRAYGVQPDWFGLGDKDLATHLVRTQMLNAGFTLTDITEALCTRWQPGVRLLPVTDDRCETHVVLAPDTSSDDRDHAESGTAIHFQQWWVKHRASLPATDFVHVGAHQATPTQQVVDALSQADLIVLAPSNPVVSIGAILAIPGMRAALRSAPAPVVGISPIIGGAVLRGMADVCLSTIGVPTAANAVAAHFGVRAHTGLLDGWLVAPEDGPSETITYPDGLNVATAPLLMSDPEATAAMVSAAIDLAGLEQPQS